MATTDGLRSIDELELAHQRVLVRVDFDVPVDEAGNITSDRKLSAAVPTIKKALSEGARVVLATHWGDVGKPALSLEPVALRLAELLGQEVYLPDEVLGDATRKVVSDLRDGQLCLLENLRFLPEESASDEVLARKLLALCDVYVSEAFGVSHLTQTSLITLPRLVKERGIGYRFRAELDGLARATSNVHKPFVGVLGGSSLSRSLPLLEAMLRRCDAILVGGAVANTLLRAKGVDVKASSYEDNQLALARNLLTRARDQKVELVLPVDVLVGSSAYAKAVQAVSVGSIPDQQGIFDIGPRTLDLFRARVGSAKTAWLHGALGAVENPEFAGGTRGLLSGLSESPGFGIVTGDSVASVAAESGPELEQRIGIVTTGGVASLVFIEGKQLPGVTALRG